MSKVRRSWVTTVMSLLLLVTVAGCSTIKKHPDFMERHERIKTVSLMPPDVEVYKIVFKGDDEIMHDLIPVTKGYAVDAIQNIFAEKGYDVQEVSFSDEFLMANPDIQQSWAMAQDAFRKFLDEIGNKKKRKKEFKYNFGAGDINQLSGYLNSDVLIFVKNSAYKKSAGERVKDFAKSVLIGVALLGAATVRYPGNAATYYIAIVEGETGDVLWYNYNPQGRDINVEKESNVKRILKRILGKFPKVKGYVKKMKGKILPAPEFKSVPEAEEKPVAVEVEIDEEILISDAQKKEAVSAEEGMARKQELIVEEAEAVRIDQKGAAVLKRSGEPSLEMEAEPQPVVKTVDVSEAAEEAGTEMTDRADQVQGGDVITVQGAAA